MVVYAVLHSNYDKCMLELRVSCNIKFVFTIELDHMHGIEFSVWYKSRESPPN